MKSNGFPPAALNDGRLEAAGVNGIYGLGSAICCGPWNAGIWVAKVWLLLEEKHDMLS